MNYSVLLKESILGLKIKKSGVYVDCTLGLAGHSIKILQKLTTGKLYCFEQDIEAIKQSQFLLKKYQNKYEIINNNFINLQSELLKRKITKVDGILYDLGVSSLQLEQKYRGFSYHYDGILDMRMNISQELNAQIVINHYNEKKLTKIFFNYGEEKFSKKISKEIIQTRKKKKILTTLELVQIIKNALPQKILKKRKHPAKKIFQAIRIEVNKELFVLSKSLYQAVDLLNKNGRLVVISFHSLEDRIVKHFFKKLVTDPNYEITCKLPIIKKYQSNYKIVTKKPIIPKLKELQLNHSSKSAKLRILEKK